ncbi:MAG: hypothetical protein ACK6DP_16915 [Gemmatimonas sp.]|jgi:Cu-Zn family superoxide dismutase|uniref:hypothetical protein n=1 Tax=Gemmatimonas sp. TaxID=1962908 RepID=UPI00391F81ED|nr:superoxide dismutase family protein [Gemmatimonadota bacterium]
MPLRVLKTALALATCSALTAFAAVRVHPNTEWRAAVAGKDGRKVTGTASAKPTADGTGTEVVLAIDGDTPGATRPWHVHAGSCTKAGPVLGGARAYAPMAIDGKGRGSATATIAAALSDTGSYYVNIHDATAAMGVIVACGDLQKR